MSLENPNWIKLSPADAAQSLWSCQMTYFDQSEPSELGFESSEALDAFVNVIAKLWEDDFGVELEILRNAQTY